MKVKAPGPKWMLFIVFCLAVGMGLAAYFSGSFTFDDLLEQVHRFKHPESQ